MIPESALKDAATLRARFREIRQKNLGPEMDQEVESLETMLEDFISLVESRASDGQKTRLMLPFIMQAYVVDRMSKRLEAELKEAPKS